MAAKLPQVAEFSTLLALVVEKWGQTITEGKKAPPELTKQLDLLSKLGKLTTVRLASVITGKWMEANPNWGVTKPTQPADPTVYAVFQDAQRHTCIRIATSAKMVTFIPMATELLVYDLSHYEFEKLYTKQLTDYPVKKAAQLYIEAKWLNSSPLAKKHLDFICGNTFTDPVSGDKPPKEPTMATAAKTAGPTPVKAPVKAATKAPAKPAAKAAPVKAAPAAKAAPAKAAKAPADKKESAGRTNKHAGKKITLVAKENPKREGTAAHAIFALYKTGQTVEQFLEAGGAVVALDYDSKKGFIKLA
jgi:hypothetical protein